MDVGIIDEEIKFDKNVCGGYKHCEDKKYKETCKDCQDCLEDMYKAMNEVYYDLFKGE